MDWLLSALEERKCREEGQRRRNSRRFAVTRPEGPKRDIVGDTLPRYREIIVPRLNDRYRRRRRNCSKTGPHSDEKEATSPSRSHVPGSRDRQSGETRWRDGKAATVKNSGAFRSRRWKSSGGRPGSGQFFARLACILSMQRMQSVVTEGVVCRAANGECSS